MVPTGPKLHLDISVHRSWYDREQWGDSLTTTTLFILYNRLCEGVYMVGMHN